MTIKNETEYKTFQSALEAIILKGTALGDMSLLSEADKREFARLSGAIAEWEEAYHPLPGRHSTLLGEEMRRRMTAMGITQREAARLMGTRESRVSELMSGKRRLTLAAARRLRDALGIPADFLLDLG